MCVLCVFIAALCSPLLPASGQCGTKFTNLFGDLLRAPNLLHSAELTTCEQTEEAAALGGKIQHFQLHICGVLASATLMTATNQSPSPGWLGEALW